jgi:hypothetical protein
MMDRNLITVGIQKVSQIFRSAGNDPDGTNIRQLWNLLMQNFGVGEPFRLLNNWRRHPENMTLVRSVTLLIIDRSTQNPNFYNAFEPIIHRILNVGEGEKRIRTTAKGKRRIEKGFKRLSGGDDPLFKKYAGRGGGPTIPDNIRYFREPDSDVFYTAASKQPKKKKKHTSKGSKEKILAAGPAPSPKPVPCNFSARMASEIPLSKPVPVTVIVSRKAIAAAKKMLQANAGALVDKNQPLVIRISAVSQMKIKGGKQVIIPVPEVKKDIKITFPVIGLRHGKCSLRVDIWQKHLNLCSLYLYPECVKKVKAKTTIRKTAKTLITDAPAEDLIRLEISERQVGRSTYYDYHLAADELGIFDEYVSPRITKQEKYVQSLYREIDKLYEDTGNDPDEIQNSLREYGADLFSYLFPPKLQKDLYDNVNKIKSIQIISTEPYIPWELLVVRNPDESKGVDPKDKFIGELGMTRWLYGWVAPRKITIRKSKAKYIIPEYTDERIVLPAAIDERKYLVETFRAKQVKGNAASIRKLLRQRGSFDLLHFCCHGEADTGKILFSRLLLQEKKDPFPTYLNQVTITQAGKFGSDKNRPMVVLNACKAGRRGNGLVGYGGFANAFLRGGAGVFIGALWSIDDETALSFITTFYKALRNGDNLAEATKKARSESARKKDTTWISYTVYGNPFAKLVSQ